MSSIVINNLRYDEKSFIETLEQNDISEIQGGLIYQAAAAYIAVQVIENWSDIKKGFSDATSGN